MVVFLKDCLGRRLCLLSSAGPSSLQDFLQRYHVSFLPRCYEAGWVDVTQEHTGKVRFRGF